MYLSKESLNHRSRRGCVLGACGRKRDQHLSGMGRRCLKDLLEGVDNVERSNSLSLGVLSVGDGVANDRLEEELEDTAGLVVDQTADTLNTTTASETADRRLCDTGDVVT